MSRITLGRHVVDLSQIDEILINRRDLLKNAGLAVSAVGLGIFAVLTREVIGLSQVVALGMMAIAVSLACWQLIRMVSAPFVLDINYKGGRGVRIECISRGHAEEIKADLIKRLASTKDHGGGNTAR
jgi:hypothetical protein